MKMKEVDRILKSHKIHSIHDMEYTLGWLRDIAYRQGHASWLAYSNALYYICTCRLSASTCYAIMDNLRDVCKKLNRMGNAGTEAIGAYLKTFCT